MFQAISAKATAFDLMHPDVVNIANLFNEDPPSMYPRGKLRREFLKFLWGRHRNGTGNAAWHPLLLNTYAFSLAME